MIIQLDAFTSLLYPTDPSTWQTKIAPIGALKATLLEDFKGPLAPYASKADLEEWKRIFLKNGFVGPTCWYKVMTRGLQFEDDKRTYRAFRYLCHRCNADLTLSHTA